MTEEIAATKENSVTIFQNGIAAFERSYNVTDQERRLSLPFKTEHVGDVVASMMVLGDVEVTEQVNYATSQQEPYIKFTSDNVSRDLLNTLRGAEIKVSLKGEKGVLVKGVNMGVTPKKMAISDADAGGMGIIETFTLTLSQETGIHQYEMDDVQSYEFSDEKIRAEITKALTASIEKIKPGNTFVYLSIKSKRATKASLRYAIPTPAWKFSYRARKTSDGWTLLGLAVVDNGTDEDWTNFKLSVATGQPVTFMTDIAEVRIPGRTKVNLVNDRAQGAVEVNSGLEDELESVGGGRPAGMHRMKALSAGGPAPAAMASFAPMAAAPQATVMESGDASVFTSEVPVTIQAHKSALVPIFSLKLREAETVLYYCPDKSPETMRALAIKNEATHNLGRGVCAVEMDEVHAGEAILSASKPGESALLCHAVEMGVHSSREEGKPRSRITAVRLSEGILITEMTTETQMTYKFRNRRDEEFPIAIDHVPMLPNSKLRSEGCREVETFKDGSTRFRLKVGKKETATCTVFESRIDQQRIESNGVLTWLQANADSPLLQQENVSKLVELQKQLDNCCTSIAASKAKVETLTREQERIRKNLDSMKGTDNRELASRLMATENEIGQEEKTVLPKLEGTKRELTDALRAWCAKATISWAAAK